ncbi:MAG: ATP-binding cassette domain-containing protein, partial [Clostridia bacterium]|nr:ATP-binding cassette domain-containing protein [Clostridia bacterium]
MYSNAALYINEKMIMRFSFSIVNLMESVAEQLNLIASGEEYKDAIERIVAGVEKLICCCPKCGRTLMRPGAECVNCMSKGQLLKKLWEYIAPQKWILILCLFMSGLATASQLVPPYITKLLVDEVLPNNDRKYLYILVLGLFLLYLLQGVLGSVRGYLVRNAGNKITSRLRSDVYAKAQYLPVSFYDKTSTGSIISRISGDTSTINSFLMTITQEAIVHLCTMVGIIVIMISLNWKLALLSLTPVPVVVLLSRYFGEKVRPIYQRIWRKWAKVSNMLTDSLPGIRVIKSFTAEKRTIKKFDEYNETWFDENKKAAALGTLFPHIYTMLMSCGSLAIWAFGGSWTMNNSSGMTVGLLVSFISYASMFYNPVRFFANLSDGYQHALTSCERVLDIIDADPEANFGKRTDIKNFRGKIEFKNVNFSFDKTKKTLDNINLTINPGDIVGIVGTTGSGKSTLINLFMRMYDGYEGEILVDGVNIKDIELEHFRSRIGFVQQ